MPIGKVDVNVRDGALGIQAASAENVFTTLGTCSLGTPNTLYGFDSTDDLVATLGAGPAVEAAALKLTIAGGPQYVMPVTASVPGVASAVTPLRVGTSTSVMTITGTPNDSYSLSVLVTSVGAGQLVTSGAVAIRISLDGGATYALPVLLPAGGTYPIAGTGLTIVFTTAASASLDLNDRFTATCQAPYYSASDLNAAFSALLADDRTWGMAHAAGYPTAGNGAANAAASAVMAVAFGSQLAAAATGYRYVRGIIDAPPSTDAELIAAFTNYADRRVRVVAGLAKTVSPISGRQMSRPWGWLSAARLAQIPPSESPGAVARGGVGQVNALLRDERKTPGLFDTRFGVALTIVGTKGYYDDFGVTMAPIGSDYSNIMNGRVMDVACAASRAALVNYLNSTIFVDAATGRILEQDARGIETFVESATRAAVGNNATKVTVITNRTDALLSTQKLRVRTRVLPVGYAREIEEDIGFDNPALTAV